MKHPILNTAAAGLGGALVVGVLFARVGIAGAQSDTTIEDTPSTTTEEPTTTEERLALRRGSGLAPWGDGDAPWGDGEGRSGPGRFGAGPGAMPFGPGFGLGAGTDDLAADLGMTPEELTAAFESGQTLPEIAEANGVNLDELFADRFGGGRFAPWGDGAPPWADQSEES